MILSILILVSCDTIQEKEDIKEKTLINTTESLEEESPDISVSLSGSSLNTNNNTELVLYLEIKENEEYEDKSMYDARCFYAMVFEHIK